MVAEGEWWVPQIAGFLDNNQNSGNDRVGMAAF